jgi:hypothetical protein
MSTKWWTKWTNDRAAQEALKQDMERVIGEYQNMPIPPPAGPQLQRTDETARLRNDLYEEKRKRQALQRAIDSVVLRLKVLDLEQMEKEQGEDGMVPLRFAISELKKLVAAFDGKSEKSYDDMWATSARQAAAMPYGLGGLGAAAGTKYPDITYTSSSNTGGIHGNY